MGGGWRGETEGVSRGVVGDEVRQRPKSACYVSRRQKERSACDDGKLLRSGLVTVSLLLVARLVLSEEEMSWARTRWMEEWDGEGKDGQARHTSADRERG